MTVRRLQSLLCALVLVPSTQNVLAQTSHADSTASAQRFTRSFYHWYTAIAQRTALTDPLAAEIAISRRPEVFSRELVAALQTDFAARAKAKDGDVVGFDGDPFLLGQDVCERYQVGRVSRQNNSYLVDVHAVCDGEFSDSADVVAELQPASGSWRFVNFHYPRAHADLIGTLRILREQRRTP